MCGGSGSSAPPQPQAPPSPTPVRDSKMDATRERQDASRKSAASGYSSTILTPKGGDTTQAPTSKATLGGDATAASPVLGS
jgi:hypothetical protein